MTTRSPAADAQRLAARWRSGRHRHAARDSSAWRTSPGSPSKMIAVLCAALLEMHVEAVVGDVELAVGEPAVVGRGAVVQHLRERLVPAQRLRACAAQKPSGSASAWACSEASSAASGCAAAAKPAGGGERPLFEQDGLRVSCRGGGFLLHPPMLGRGAPFPEAPLAAAMVRCTNASFASAGGRQHERIRVGHAHAAVQVVHHVGERAPVALQALEARTAPDRPARLAAPARPARSGASFSPQAAAVSSVSTMCR